MDDLDMGSAALRLERGSATPEELAALTAVLLARRSMAREALDAAPQATRVRAGWRAVRRYEAPHSWR